MSSRTGLRKLGQSQAAAQCVDGAPQLRATRLHEAEERSRESRSQRMKPRDIRRTGNRRRVERGKENRRLQRDRHPGFLQILGCRWRGECDADAPPAGLPRARLRTVSSKLCSIHGIINFRKTYSVPLRGCIIRRQDFEVVDEVGQVRPQRMKEQPLAFHLPAIEFRRRDCDRMAALAQPDPYGDVGMQIAQRPECRQ